MLVESTCAVCELPRNDVRLRNSALVCTACNSFFLDTVDGDKFDALECKEGDNQCLTNGTTLNTAIVCGNGRIWRFTCKKCRFNKCLAVGMQRLRRVKKRKQSKEINVANTNTNNNNNNQMLTTLVKVLPCGEEPFLSAITNQFQTMRQDFIKVAPLIHLRCIKQEDFSEMFLRNCVVWGRHVCSLVKQWPGFKSLTITERCAIYPLAAAAMNSLHLATYNSLFGNCSLENIKIMVEKAPVLLHPFTDDNYGPAQFRSQIMTCQLDIQEQAFVAYLLYFGNEDVPASYERRRVIQNANQWMELYQVNKYNGDYALARNRLSSLWQWFHLAINYSKRYINALLASESKEISSAIGKLFIVYK